MNIWLATRSLRPAKDSAGTTSDHHSMARSPSRDELGKALFRQRVLSIVNNGDRLPIRAPVVDGPDDSRHQGIIQHRKYFQVVEKLRPESLRARAALRKQFQDAVSLAYQACETVDRLKDESIEVFTSFERIRLLEASRNAFHCSGSRECRPSL
jgi:hypothetical protein